MPRRRERDAPPNTGRGLNKSSLEYRVFCLCLSNVEASANVNVVGIIETVWGKWNRRTNLIGQIRIPLSV